MLHSEPRWGREILQGSTPETNGKFGRFVGLMKTFGRRMPVSALLDTNFWSWAVEQASEVLRVNALKPEQKIIPFRDRVVVRTFPFGKQGWESQGMDGR